MEHLQLLIALHMPPISAQLSIFEKKFFDSFTCSNFFPRKITVGFLSLSFTLRNWRWFGANSENGIFITAT